LKNVKLKYVRNNMETAKQLLALWHKNQQMTMDEFREELNRVFYNVPSNTSIRNYMNAFNKQLLKAGRGTLSLPATRTGFNWKLLFETVLDDNRE
jgi:predicted HTH transcriptional regulator